MLILFRFAKCAWIPVFVTFGIVAGVNGKSFINVQTEPTSIAQIFTFGSTVAGFMLAWALIGSDFTVYFHPDIPRSVGFHGCLRQSDLDKPKQLANFHVLIRRSYHSYCKIFPGSPPLPTSNRTQITIQCLGAAAAGTAPSIPHWAAGYNGGNVGGLIDSMLLPVGKFGKVLMVLLSLSVTNNKTPTVYSTGMALQTLIPSLLVVPRYVFSVLVTAL
jgi:purine-cytosine permease-like protein